MLFGVVVDGRLLGELLEHADERRQDGFVGASDKMRERAAEVGGGFLEVVVRYAGEHVMHLVRADAVDDVVHNAVVTVDRGQLSTHEVPPIVRVPGRVDLVMMEERDDNDVRAEH